MKLLNRFNLMLHACVLLGTMAFCAADEKPLLALVALIATAASCILTSGPRSERPPMLPRAAINVLVFAAIVNAAVRASGNTLNDEFVSTLGQFLVFIVVIKLLDRRAARDDAQLITLTIFIAVAAVLTAGSLPVGLLLILYVPTAVATSMVWQLRAGQMMVAADALAITSSPPPGERPAGTLPIEPRIAVGRRPARALVAICAVAVLASSSIATAVFVLVPRGVGSDLFGRFAMQSQTQMGFREAVRLGEAGFLSENPMPVMDVQLTTGSGSPIGGAGEVLYLRGAARDEYQRDQFVWQDPSAGGNIGDPPDVKMRDGYEYFLTLRNAVSRDRSRESSATPLSQRVQKVTMRAESAGGTMFCLWRPTSIVPDRNVDTHVSPRNGTMRHTSPVGQHFSYTVKSNISDELSHAPRPPHDFQGGRIHDLAGDVLARARASGPLTSRQAITVLRDYLRTNYAYTLELVAPPAGVDPIEFFLFDRKKGHCEYFASAMAAMCQSQGIPCRVITGYVTSEFNSLTGTYLVRESNAHAWVEAFVVTEPETDDGRWETFDASPPADIERIHKPAGGLLASLRGWYDALEFGWTSSVIGYDNASAARNRNALTGGSRISARFEAWSDQFVTWLKTVRANPTTIPAWLRYAPLGLLALVGVWIVIRRRVLRSGWWRMRGSSREQFAMSAFKPTGAYAKALRALHRAGVPKPEQTPPALHADTIETRFPEAAARLRAVAAMFYRSHFGGRPLDAAETRQMDDLVRQLETALQTPFPGQRSAGAPAN